MHGARAAALALPLVAVLAAGCWRSAQPTSRPSFAADPCAERLHALCGVLVQHYATTREFPRSREDLEKLVAGAGSGPLVCPASGKPYRYVPGGLEARTRALHLVLYDPEPVHAGKRWAVIFTQTKPTGPLTARVVLIEDDVVRAAEAREPR